MIQTVEIKYRKDDYMRNCWYVDTIEFMEIPGKFEYHDAINITKMLNNGFRIPSVIECTTLLTTLRYTDLLGNYITNEANEFGEDGNFIYVASTTTDITKTIISTGEYDYAYKDHPVRNAYCKLILIKTISRKALDTYGKYKNLDINEPLDL